MKSRISLLGAAVSKLLETAEPCVVCGGPLVLSIPIGGEGTPYTRVYHEPGCPLAA